MMKLMSRYIPVNHPEAGRCAGSAALSLAGACGMAVGEAVGEVFVVNPLSGPLPDDCCEEPEGEGPEEEEGVGRF